MEAIKLLAVFLVMLILIFSFKRSLSVAFGIGCVLLAGLFQFDPREALELAVQSVLSRSTLAIVAIYYTVTFLQKMMELKGHISLAETSLLNITNNKRLSAAAAPMCVGLMPSPGAVIIGGAMVESIYGDSVNNEDKNFVTSYFRHVPEAFVPTYGAIVLACELAGVPAGEFVLYMLPMAAAVYLAGYFMVLIKLPKETGLPPKKEKLKDLRNILLALWPISAIILLVLSVHVDVYLVTIFVIILYFFVNRFKFQQIKPFFKSSFESKIIFSTIFILIFKDFALTSGAVDALPHLLARLPLPDYLIFSLVFFIGSVVAGATAVAAIGIPMAYVAMPDGGVPLLVLLSTMAFLAMQVSISHICLFLSSIFFKVEVASLIKRTIPVISVLCLIVIGYYLILA